MAGPRMMAASLLLSAWILYSSAEDRVLEVAPQTCGLNNTEFFCPHRPQKTCLPRSERCTDANVCRNPSTGFEDSCYLSQSAMGFEVRLGQAQFADRHGTVISQQFVTYRGFTYEFGEEYGVQILDISDPLYKYKNGAHGFRSSSAKGTSLCLWEDATEFSKQWVVGENWHCSNNCSNFAKMLLGFLTSSRCNRIPSLSEDERQRVVGQWLEKYCSSCNVTDNHRSEL